MPANQPSLYVSRLLPEPVMAAIHDRYRLVQNPIDRQADESAMREGLQEADAAIVTLRDCIDASMIQRAPKLKILANYAVGYNNIDLDAATRRGLVVTNTPNVLTDATADLTWALLLATARRLVEGDALVRSG
ncbi:MAG TPA: D-glycerate dehydrogenase, partial [Nitrospira sp.]